MQNIEANLRNKLGFTPKNNKNWQIVKDLQDSALLH